MIAYIVRRLVMLIPTVFGISLVTFILINLAIDNAKTSTGFRTASSAGSSTGKGELGRAYGLHLPLFLNFRIQDIQSRTNDNIKNLADPLTREAASRSLVRTGGAVLPYLLPMLPSLKDDSQAAALDVLDQISIKIGIYDDVKNSRNKTSFWMRYNDSFGADYDSVRAKRLVRRYIHRNDQLALSQLKQLGTYSLPQLMDAMNNQLSPEHLNRLVRLLCKITGRNDFFEPEFTPRQQQNLISRWKEWWAQRYDLYTAFEGFSKITGAVSETRYFKWLIRVVTFDFGVSSRDGRPIRKIIAERLPVTLLLTFLALLVSYVIAIPLGVIAAVKRGSLFDRITAVVLFVLYSLPTFWVAMILLRYFGSTRFLNWFPAQGLNSVNLPLTASFMEVAKDTAHHLVLPVLCLSFVSIAMLARYQRIGMLGVTEQNFIRTAKAKGLSKMRVITGHALRNGIIPVITLMGLQLPYLVSSSIVIERIFGIKGMGMETFDAIRASDYYWLTAVITVTAVLTMLGILASDVIYAIVDPRIVPGRKPGRNQ